MGWVEEHHGSYRARWRDGGETVTVTCATKTEAQQLVADMETDRRRGVYIDPRGGQTLLRDWAELWMESRSHLKLSAAAADKSRMANHIEPALGRYQLDAITPSVVRRWVADLLAKPLAAKTVRNCHGLLHSLMQAAVDERLIASNPCRKTPLPAANRNEMHFLTTVELERLITATVKHYQPLIITLAGTGMRWGEAVGLTRRRVDLQRGRLEIAQTLEEVGGTITVGTPKTRRSRRTVTLPEAVVTAIAPLCEGDPDDLVFATPQDRPVRNTNFNVRVWNPALAAAKLPDTVRVHDLRHTHAAHLISAGVPLTAISRRLGHTSIQVTSDVYGHLLPEVDEQLLTVLDGMLPVGEHRGASNDFGQLA